MPTSLAPHSTPRAPTPLSGGYAPDARRWLLVADVLLAAGTTMLVIGLRRTVNPDLVALDGAGAHAHLWLLTVFDLLLVMRLGIYGTYETRQRFARIDDLMTVLRAAFVAAAFSVFLAALTKGFFTGYTNFSRLYLAWGFALPTLMLCAARVSAHQLQTRAFRAGRYLVRTLVIGTGERGDSFLAWITERRYLGMQAVRSEAPLDDGVDAFARSLSAELDRVRPDEVVLALEEGRSDVQVAVVREAAFRGIAVRVLPGVFESYQAAYFEYGGLPVTTLFETPPRRFARRMKAIGDRLAAALGLLALSPLFVLVALLIRVGSRGPVFYRQPRVGLHGRRFELWKFRSMRADADDVLAGLLAASPEAAAEWEVDQKLRDDPRITRVGRFIRRWSIDELPQLINVVFGEMSLVGPRPPMPDQVGIYGVSFVFSQMRPGITGLWQVSGRNELTFAERVDLEAYYVENWSFRLDLLILLKTVRVVFGRRGAY